MFLKIPDKIENDSSESISRYGFRGGSLAYNNTESPVRQAIASDFYNEKFGFM